MSFFTSLYVKAQPFRVTKNITVNEGLPSNIIYSLLEDDRGFLWIGTDNGVARFDGKYIRTFNTRDGLPDNEILEIFKEKDGTIWVNTFKQGPFYFDEKKNIFVDPLKGIDVNKEFIKLIMYGNTLEEGGITFYNQRGEFVFKKRKLVKSWQNTAYSFMHSIHQELFYSKNIVKDKLNSYIYFKENNRIDSVLLYSASPEENVTNITLQKDRKLYTLTSKGNLYIIGSLCKSPYKLGIDSIHIGREAASLRIAKDNINIITRYGEIYSYDINSLKLRFVAKGDFIANCLWHDKNNNVWVGTSSKGIMLYKESYIRLLNVPENKIDYNFSSIYTDGSGKLFAGNYYGEVIEHFGDKNKINLTSKDRKIKRIRKILVSQNKVFTFSEQECTVDYKRKLLLNGNTPLGQAKTAVILNDSIIIIGGVNPSGGLYKLNTITETVSKLNCDVVRITSMAVLGKGYIYLGSLDGIYKYDYLKNITYSSNAQFPLFGKRIIKLETLGNDLLCIATATNGLYILHNDKIIKQINNPLLTNYAVTALKDAGDNTFWVGTRNGLNKIKYQYSPNSFKYMVHNFHVTEGLPTNTINDICCYNDFVYVATEKGICYLHKKMVEPSERIRLYLTRVTVNNKDLEIKNAYSLKYSERSVKMEFSGVNLGGHLKNLFYSVDDGVSWSNMQNNFLNLELVPGNLKLLVKGANLYNALNEKPLSIRLSLRAPLYRRTWFLTSAVAILFSVIAYIFYRNKLLKEKRLWDHQFKLNQERNRITADLHDGIGSTISSLQIYSEVAYNLAETDTEKVKKILKHITNDSANIAEDISDIIWSLKGLSVSTLSLSGRIRNFVSEVLGPSDIKYEIDIIPDLYEAENIILCRKNIFLIIKEAINNILKYSNARFVKIKLLYKNKKYMLTIEDDGKGFDINKVGLKGNGLGNMKRRTEDLGGHFELITTEGSGTIIKMIIPQKM